MKIIEYDVNIYTYFCVISNYIIETPKSSHKKKLISYEKKCVHRNFALSSLKYTMNNIRYSMSKNF